MTLPSKSMKRCCSTLEPTFNAPSPAPPAERKQMDTKQDEPLTETVRAINKAIENGTRYYCQNPLQPWRESEVGKVRSRRGHLQVFSLRSARWLPAHISRLRAVEPVDASEIEEAERLITGTPEPAILHICLGCYARWTCCEDCDGEQGQVCRDCRLEEAA